jgi:hypothetical protein
MQILAGFIGLWELTLILPVLLVGWVIYRVAKFIRRKPPQN